jgi:low affinity Fe/Cu permease
MAKRQELKRSIEQLQSFNSVFDRFSSKATRATGSPYAFIVAVITIIVWGITGPIFHYSDTWQLVINTGTTIITFLMVFIIQQTQNKDTIAIHLKLDELLASSDMASNRLVDAEDLTEEELRVLKKFYTRLSKRTGGKEDLHATHSIEEAEEIKKEKKQQSANSHKK